MSEGIKLEPMSKELFLASTYQAGLNAQEQGRALTLDLYVRQLEQDGYFDETPRDKRAYVLRKMQTMKDEEGRRVFHRIR